MKKIPTATLNIEETRRRATTSSRSNPMNRIRKTIMTQTSLFGPRPLKLTKPPIGTSTLGIATLLVGLHIGTAQAVTIFTNNDAANSHLHTAGNWDNGLPTGGSNPGTVGTGKAATFTSGFYNYDVNFNENARLTGSGTSWFTLASGTSFTFNDDSVLTITGRTRLGGGDSASSLTLNDNATASMTGDIFSFGINDEAGGMSLSLNGNSSFSINASSTINRQTPGGPYRVNLSDSAVWETVAPNSNFSIALSQVTVNFQQADEYFTPIWKIPEYKSFASANTAGAVGVVQYQINGVNTTLADSRFVQTSGVDGFNTLQLVVIPEPSTLVLFGLAGLASLSLLRRRRR